jgi:hypothetical protein
VVTVPNDKPAKVIWVPTSRTEVTVQDGQVYVTETMVMQPKAIKPATGFRP